MLRITASKSASGAIKYFDEALAKSDYYIDKEESMGKWGGKLAADLKLDGVVNREDFAALANNRIPGSITEDSPDGEKLTVRDSANRKAGYDFTFSVPKSVSIQYAMTGDKEIMEAFNNSIDETLNHIEKDFQTQARNESGKKFYQTTSNMLFAKFTHEKTRPVERTDQSGDKTNIPDPHLHQHVYIFNATWNKEKERMQAGEFGNLKKYAPFFQAYFHSALAKNLQEAGYAVEKNKKDFEIAGYDQALKDKFSGRTIEINQLAKVKGIQSDKLKSNLGAETRKRKDKHLNEYEVKDHWKSRLSHEERVMILTRKSGNAESPSEISPTDAIDKALSHNLERRSTALEKRVLGDAISFSAGSLPPAAILDEWKKRTDVIKATDKNGVTQITTHEARKEEAELIHGVNQGRGKYKALNNQYETKAEFLNEQQKEAVQHALTSKDQVVLIRGAAGTGKTTLMQEVKTGIKEENKRREETPEKKEIRMFAFAPTSEAAKVQKKEGFEHANTVANLLVNKKLQQELSGGVMWVDEAGMLSNKQMNGILKIAKDQKARMILTGDARQHSSVERGDALRVIEQRSALKIAEVTEVVRQRGQATYKKAMQNLGEGKYTQGYNTLEKMGAIKEIEDHKTRNKAIVKDYIETSSQKNRKGKEKSVLVVSPTHAEIGILTKEIRCELKQKNRIGGEERTFKIHKNLNLTNAEKQQASNYSNGHSIQFFQNEKGFKAGSKFEVVGVENNKVMVKDSAGEIKSLNRNNPNRFQVYQTEEINLTKGDKIQVTANGKAQDGSRVLNGSLKTVLGFEKDGSIILDDRKRLDKGYRNFNYGYVTTSHKSQGKTVDKVIVAQSSISFAASSQEQFYVSTSRGKSEVSIYTDDKKELKSIVTGRSSQRMTAEEIARKAAQNRTRVEKTKEALKNYYKLSKTYVKAGKNKMEEILNKNRSNGTKRNIQKPSAPTKGGR